MSVPVAILVSAILLLIFLAVIRRVINLRVVAPVLVVVFLIVGLGINIAPAVELLEEVTANMFGVAP